MRRYAPRLVSRAGMRSLIARTHPLPHFRSEIC